MSTNKKYFSTTLLTATMFLLMGTTQLLFAATKPDNTKVNERDRNQSKLEAQDQGNSNMDLELTRRIRQNLVKDESFSTDAKNIKIISLDGVVTLRGPVDSAAEKSAVEKVARRTSGDSKIINQIEIKR